MRRLPCYKAVSFLFCAALSVAVTVQAQTSDLGLQPDMEDAGLRQRLSRPLSLDDCIQIAIQYNLPLAIARLERDAVRTDVGAAWGAWLPEFSVTASRFSNSSELDSVVEETGTDVQATMTQRLPMGGNVEVGYALDKSGEDLKSGAGASVAITQPLLRNFGWRRAFADVTDANLATRSEEAALRAQFLEVVFRVKSAYYEVIRSQKLVEVNERAIERDEELVAFSRAKMEAKLATRRDLLSAEIILAQDRGKLVNAQTAKRDALDALAEVLGLRIPTSIEIEYVDVDLAPTPRNEEAWMQQAMQDNPEIRRAQAELERDLLAKRVAGNERLPQLDLTLAYAQLRDPILEDPAEPKERARQYNVRGEVKLTYPFLNKPLANAHRAAQLRYEQARRLLQDAQRRVALQVRDTVRSLERIEETIQVLEKTIEGAEEKVAFANVNFQLGRASNLDITDAQKDLLDAETDYVDELVNYRVELARLEQLLGGSIQ